MALLWAHMSAAMSALARADAMAALWVHTSQLGSALLMVQGRERASED
jgi:hypothetical protein